MGCHCCSITADWTRQQVKLSSFRSCKLLAYSYTAFKSQTAGKVSVICSALRRDGSSMPLLRGTSSEAVSFDRVSCGDGSTGQVISDDLGTWLSDLSQDGSTGQPTSDGLGTWLSDLSQDGSTGQSTSDGLGTWFSGLSQRDCSILFLLFSSVSSLSSDFIFSLTLGLSSQGNWLSFASDGSSVQLFWDDSTALLSSLTDNSAVLSSGSDESTILVLSSGAVSSLSVSSIYKKK